MDGLSAATTVVSVLQTAAQVVSYIRAVKDAGTERQKLLVELVRTRGLLATLTDLTEVAESDDWARALQNSNGPDGPLLEFKVLLEEIIAELGATRATKSASRTAQSASVVSEGKSSRFLSHRQREFRSGSSPLVAQAKNLGDSSEHEARSDTYVGIKVNNALQNLKWPFSQDRQKELLIKLERIKTHFLVALTSDNVRLSKLIFEEVQTTHVKVDVIKDNTRTIRKHIEGSKEWTVEQQLLFDSISSLEFARHTPRHELERLQNGARWVLANEIFCRWHSCGGTLLLSGKAGTGKTSIFRVVENYLRPADDADVFVVAIYYSLFRKTGEQSLQAVLAYIVGQMLRVRPQFQKYYNKLMLTGQGQLEVADALRIIHRARQDFQHFYIMLDALDECDLGQAQELVEMLVSLRSPPRIFATSRPGPLTKLFSDTITITDKAIEADLEAYIRERLTKHPFGRPILEESPDPLELARDVATILSLSDGMFMYATIFIDHLGKAQSRDEYEKMLAEVVSTKRSAAVSEA